MAIQGEVFSFVVVCLFVVRTEVEGDADYHNEADVSTSNSPKPLTPSL